MGKMSIALLVTMCATACGSMVDTPQTLLTTGGKEELIQNGYLTGDIGPRHGFDGPAAASGQDAGEFQATSLKIVIEDPDRGGAMVLFYAGNARLTDFPLGSYELDGTAVPDLDDPISQVGINLCSGPTSHDIDFDTRAVDIGMDVSEIQDGLNFDIAATADIDHDPSFSHFTFDVIVP